MQFSHNKRSVAKDQAVLYGFTLIELLIVVAIIAILAAIAVPNFLEAQTRAKVSATKSNMRTLKTGVESYYVDNNKFPTAYGVEINDVDWRYGFYLLSTPVAYISNPNVQDLFVDKEVSEPHYTTLQWDPMTADGRMFSLYNIGEPGGGYIVESEQPTWYVIISNGPDLQGGWGDYSRTGGPLPGDPEADIQRRFREADQNPGDLMDTVYDPTNGTISIGNIYAVGGSTSDPALDIARNSFE